MVDLAFIGNNTLITRQQNDKLLTVLKKYIHVYENISLHIGASSASDRTVLPTILENSLAQGLTVYYSDEEKGVSVKVSEVYDLSIKRFRYAEKSYPSVFEKNRRMIESARVLIAVPREEREQKNSETWMAIRYAKNQKKAVIIIYPDGRATKWPVKTTM